MECGEKMWENDEFRVRLIDGYGINKLCGMDGWMDGWTDDGVKVERMTFPKLVNGY